MALISLSLSGMISVENFGVKGSGRVESGCWISAKTLNVSAIGA